MYKKYIHAADGQRFCTTLTKGFSADASWQRGGQTKRLILLHTVTMIWTQAEAGLWWEYLWPYGQGTKKTATSLAAQDRQREWCTQKSFRNPLHDLVTYAASPDGLPHNPSPRFFIVTREPSIWTLDFVSTHGQSHTGVQVFASVGRFHFATGLTWHITNILYHHVGRF